MAGPGVTRTGNFFSLIGVAEDWTAAQIFGLANPRNEVKIKRISLLGGTGLPKWGTIDRVVIRQGGTAGATICTLATPNPNTPDTVYFKRRRRKDGEKEEEGQYMEPFIDYLDSIFNTGHRLVFELA